MKHPDHLSLDAVLDEPLGFEFELPFSLERLDREPLLAISPVRIGGQVSRVEGGYSMDARVAFAGELECSRCLAAYPFALDEPFSLILYPRSGSAAEERELDRGDLDVSYYDTDVVPIAPIAEERVQLAIPMKPLCREECLGLCPHCGEDLNSGACDCRVEAIDPRWQALRELPRDEKA